MNNFVSSLHQILLDGPGMLKFDDFSLSRVEGEDLNELFESTVGEDDGSSQDSADQGTNGDGSKPRTLGEKRLFYSFKKSLKTHLMSKAFCSC